MSYRKFNINNYVKVKLTDYGLQVYCEQFNKPLLGFPTLREHLKTLDSVKMEADSEGHHSFQMWHFMELFGSSVGIAKDKVFELDIIIEDKDLQTV